MNTQHMTPYLALAITMTFFSTPGAADPDLEEDRGLFHSGLLSGWKRELDAGINGSNGNTESLSIHLGFKTAYEDPDKIWKFDSAYDNASSDSDESRNQFFAELQRDWLWRGSPWFTFAQGRYDWDAFKDWISRVSFSVGPGYQFIKNPRWDVKGRLGLGGNKTYGDDDGGFSPEALIGLSVDWNISERESFAFATTFYPNLEEGGEFRNISTLDWKMSMDEYGKLAMKIGLSNEYDSLASEEVEQNDFKYHLALVWAL